MSDDVKRLPDYEAVAEVFERWCEGAFMQDGHLVVCSVRYGYTPEGCPVCGNDVKGREALRRLRGGRMTTATRSPWDTLMALLPPRDYSLRLIAAHHIVEAAVLHYDGSAPIVALSATGRTPEAALEALLTRWRGEQAA